LPVNWQVLKVLSQRVFLKLKKIVFKQKKEREKLCLTKK